MKGTDRDDGMMIGEMGKRELLLLLVDRDWGLWIGGEGAGNTVERTERFSSDSLLISWPKSKTRGLSKALVRNQSTMEALRCEKQGQLGSDSTNSKPGSDRGSSKAKADREAEGVGKELLD